jgi:hypothetical protein
MKTLEEKNRMIAEFMGKEWHKSFFKDVCIINPSNISYQFHISWDWLMPVVEKIESLEYSVEKNLQRIDGDFQCLITKGNDILFQEFAVKSIEAMHYVVVEFINFYNEQK